MRYGCLFEELQSTRSIACFFFFNFQNKCYEKNVKIIKKNESQRFVIPIICGQDKGGSCVLLRRVKKTIFCVSSAFFSTDRDGIATINKTTYVIYIIYVRSIYVFTYILLTFKIYIYQIQYFPHTHIAYIFLLLFAAADSSSHSSRLYRLPLRSKNVII